MASVSDFPSSAGYANLSYRTVGWVRPEITTKGAGNSRTASRLLCGRVVVAIPTQRKVRAHIYVSIVSANPETLDGLQAYLSGVGVSSHCTRAVQDLALVVPRLATAAVIFPDDFENEAVRMLVRDLRRERPSLLSLIVTREPQCFRDVVQDDGRSLPPIVLPKPSFGWDILDAIRAHSETGQV